MYYIYTGIINCITVSFISILYNLLLYICLFIFGNCLTLIKLKTNINKVIKDIPKEKYNNIIKGTYNRIKKYSKKSFNRRKTLKNYL